MRAYNIKTHHFIFADMGYKTPCWLWSGARNKDGYGVVKINGKGISVHRFMYREHHKIDMVCVELDHLCKVRRCGNPEHLESVSRTTNIRRGSHTKLDVTKVRQIKLCLRVGFNQHIIGSIFNVANSTICDIKRGKTWKMV